MTPPTPIQGPSLVRNSSQEISPLHSRRTWSTNDGQVGKGDGLGFGGDVLPDVVAGDELCGGVVTGDEPPGGVVTGDEQLDWK